MDVEARLTELAHGGGCGCKLAPAMLQEILAGMPATAFPNLLVGTETADDAAVYRLNDQQAIVATTDFFTPVVDDPYQFGRIAATNALSDVYAMGATPFLALALLGMPLGKVAPETARRIAAGGGAVCAEAGIPVAGGHSIDSPEPLYGLVGLGLVHPDRLLRNSTGQPGDALILTKGLGIGVFSAALKRGVLSPADYATMLASTTQLNRIGADLAGLGGVHAVTDVTGFGLLGHALEMCRGAGLLAELRCAAIPVLPGAAVLAASGVATGAAARNWASYGDKVQLATEAALAAQGLLSDPQTSGGLLIACAADRAEVIVAHARRAGFAQSVVIGRLREGAPSIIVA